jgi:alcohol dehydrogenase
MRAFVLKRYGDASGTGLADVAQPLPGPTDLLIKVTAAGLNPVDFKTRKGDLKAVMRLKLPAVMGNELSGTVAAVGANVRRFKPGDAVYARVDKGRMGALAEYACVDAGNAAPVPKSLDMVTAAGVPLAALTSLQALRDELKIGPGRKVLITGGAGGVGTFAIQIAKWLGAEVTTTASPRGEALVRSLGADHVIDYTQGRLQDRPERFDGAFDLLGGETLDATFALVKPGGTIVSVAGVPEPQMALKDLGGQRLLAAALWFISRRIRARAREAGVTYRFLLMHPSGEDLAMLGGLIDHGHVKVIIDRVFPLAETAAAFAYLEGGRAKGKVVVRVA